MITRVTVIDRPRSRAVIAVREDGHEERIESVFRGRQSDGRYYPPIAEGDALIERAEKDGATVNYISR